MAQFKAAASNEDGRERAVAPNAVSRLADYAVKIRPTRQRKVLPGSSLLQRGGASLQAKQHCSQSCAVELGGSRYLVNPFAGSS